MHTRVVIFRHATRHAVVEFDGFALSALQFRVRGELQRNLALPANIHGGVDVGGFRFADLQDAGVSASV